jgi:cell division protein FtsI/penicillin-binding protein 2
VIADSNNIGVAKVAVKLGPKLYDHYRKVGFGTKTGLQWPGEQPGFVNPPNRWSRSSILVLSFGYEATVSLIQMATAFGVLANDGYLVRPTIVKQDKPHRSAEPLYSKRTINEMLDILAMTVDHGTGKNAAINGYTVRGKTGTANLVVNGKYSPHNNIYSFIGIVEKDSYKRVILTFLKDIGKRGAYASSTAAPLFSKIAEKVLIHDKVI